MRDAAQELPPRQIPTNDEEVCFNDPYVVEGQRVMGAKMVYCFNIEFCDSRFCAVPAKSKMHTVCTSQRQRSEKGKKRII